MSVEKIIYVTPGESELGELTNIAGYQLRQVVTNVLEQEKLIDLPKVFRATKNNAVSTADSLLYLANTCRKTSNDSGELLYNNLIANPGDIREIINSTRKGDIAIVVGVTKNELRNILDILQKDGYIFLDDHKIKHQYSVYAVTINPNDRKESTFFESPWRGT